MPRNGDDAKTETQTFYDRIADVHNIALKINGYRASVAKYLTSLNLNISPDAVVLDAGSGTGIVTNALHDTGLRFRRIFSLDLSPKSLVVAREDAPGLAAAPASTSRFSATLAIYYHPRSSGYAHKLQISRKSILPQSRSTDSR